jgi:allantoicase
LGKYIIPGLFCGVLSAILQTINLGKNQRDLFQINPRNNFTHGGLQMAAVGLSIGFAIASGAINGVIFRQMNKNQKKYYDDLDIYSSGTPLVGVGGADN